METPDKKKFFLFRWIDFTSEAGGVLASICLLCVTFIVVYEVAVRYLLNAPTTWVGEMSIYFCMALGFLSLAYGLKNDQHLSITVVTERLTPKNRLRLKIFTDFVGALYCTCFIYKGAQLAYFAYDLEDVSSGMMETPLWIIWCLVPIGGLLLALQFVNKLADDVKALKQL